MWPQLGQATVSWIIHSKHKKQNKGKGKKKDNQNLKLLCFENAIKKSKKPILRLGEFFLGYIYSERSLLECKKDS